MRYSTVCKICKPALLTGFLLLAICQNLLFAQTKDSEINGYDKASYSTSQAGKFMKTWLVAGPVPVNPGIPEPPDSLQQKTFETDLISVVNVVAGKQVPPVATGQKDFKWERISLNEDVINLDTFYQGKDFVYAYALAEITAPAAMNVVLGVGSDDGIKVWLNGKLVHSNWVPRGAIKDNDLVALKLVRGSNQLLFKVQDMKGGWGFVARMLDKAALTQQLNIAAGNGNLDKVKLLIQGGADVNNGNEAGITPIIAAKTGGRDDVVRLLLKNGAEDKNVPSPEILVDNLYSSLKGKEAPGIAVLVGRDSNVLYSKGFGYADIKNKILITPDTKFRIGSVTKQFTAAAILKLQESGLLSVNDKLSKFIPDFPRGDEVTIHQLLTHTSGIHSYTDKDDFVSRVTTTISPDTLINSIKKDPYDFNPGEKWQYDNSGYFLLGYIIGKVSGKPYAQYLRETFFDPLGMKNTGIHYAGIKLEHEAKGYSKTDNRYEDAINWDMSWAGGAGSIYSTTGDLMKWNQALYGGRVINEKSLQAAITPVVLKSGEQTAMRYGYGLMLNNYRGEDIIGHSGGLHGFVTQLTYYPKEKLTVVMFSNNAEPEVNFDPNKIAEAFLWNKLRKQVSYGEAATKPKNLQLYTGRYDLSGFAVITISVENNKLYSQITGQPKLELLPFAEDEFFWKVVDAQIKFVKNETGAISHIVLFQNGQELKANKLKEEAVVSVNPAILDAYTGRYKDKDNMIVTISKDNNKLYGQATGQAKLELLPLSDTAFVIKELNAKLSFVKDDTGKVNRIRLNLNGSDNELIRIE